MTKNTQVIVTVGLPGSGKSTWAKRWVEINPTERVRVNKDELRAMLHQGKYSKGNEAQVLALETEIIHDALARGKSVVVDNTHLAKNKDGLNKHFQRIKAHIEVGYEKGKFEMPSMSFKIFNDVPPEECIKRDLIRPNSVGQNIIWRMYWDHVSPISTPTYKLGNPPAIIVDVDGTLAEMISRGPFDWHKVGEDRVRWHILTMVQIYAKAGYKILVFTGRDGCCATETLNWLDQAKIPHDEFYIRDEGDTRKDYIVKAEMYDQVKDRYNVMLVIDDRPQVIRMWRRQGLPVINANPCDKEF